MTDLWPDADVGEMISDGIVLSFEAASTITKGDLVYLSTNMKVSKCSAATQYAVGVALNTVATGEFCSVCVRGVIKVTAGGTIDRGKAVQTDANAKAIQQHIRQQNCPTESLGLLALPCRPLPAAIPD
jgi:hypothetical protein